MTDSMTDPEKSQVPLPAHGALILPSVIVDSYILEAEDEDGFVGDKASKGAFADILDKWRKPLKEVGEDPFGEKPSNEISRKKLATLLERGDPKEAALVQSAIEEFAQCLASVIRRFLRFKEWHETELVTVGGGFSESQVGKLAIGRSALLLKSSGVELDIDVIHNNPDEAGLLGTAHLLPAWMLNGHDAMLALDIGGTNIRAGVVELNLKQSAQLAEARVGKLDLWRHAGETEREAAVDRMGAMLQSLIGWSEKRGLRLAPVIGVGCPGVIQEDGTIDRGAQNLPGNWESSRFNLPGSIRSRIPTIGKQESMVVMHNDAVVQGLSELPHLKDRLHWGVLTIGTGLGNARFSTRRPFEGRERRNRSR